MSFGQPRLLVYAARLGPDPHLHVVLRCDSRQVEPTCNVQQRGERQERRHLRGGAHLGDVHLPHAARPKAAPLLAQCCDARGGYERGEERSSARNDGRTRNGKAKLAEELSEAAEGSSAGDGRIDPEGERLTILDHGLEQGGCSNVA